MDIFLYIIPMDGSIKNIIYCLIDPITKQVRYIGKTNNINKRLANHIQRKQNKTYKSCWIYSLKKKGFKPIIEILDIVGEDWEFWEAWYICLYKSWGFKLTNLTSGGIGIKSNTYSLELREKMGIHLRKSIEQFDLQGKFIKEWRYVGEASKDLSIQKSGISKVCKGERKTCGGYKWKFK